MHCVNGNWVPGAPPTADTSDDKLPGQRSRHALRERQLGAEYGEYTAPTPADDTAAHDAGRLQGCASRRGMALRGYELGAAQSSAGEGCDPRRAGSVQRRNLSGELARRRLGLYSRRLASAKSSDRDCHARRLVRHSMFEAREGTSALRALGWNAAAPALLVAAALLSAAPASAQITKINTADLLTMFIRGVDVASDTSGGALVVSAQDAVLAHCITADGVLIRSVTLKPASGGKPFGAFPRARYNPATAQYLVVWPEEQVSGALLKGRTLSCATGALGVEHIIGATAWLESGAALDWSATSGQYLVAWKAYPSTLLQVQMVAARCDARRRAGRGLGRLRARSGSGLEPDHQRVRCLVQC